MKNIIMIALFIVAFSIEAKAQEAKASQKKETACCTAAPNSGTATGKACNADKDTACAIPVQGCCPEFKELCGSDTTGAVKNESPSSDIASNSCKADGSCCQGKADAPKTKS